MANWLENARPTSGNRLVDGALASYQKLQPDLYRFLSKRFFDTSVLLGIGGESVVVRSDTDSVNKFMFRKPGGMPLEHFRIVWNTRLTR